MATFHSNINEYVSPGGFRVSGAWSKAGFATCVRVSGPTRRDDVLFDCGVLNDENLRTSIVLISHGHADHIGSCVQHARARALSQQPASYYVPASCLDGLHQLKAAFEELDGHEIPMKIFSISPGQRIQLTHSLSVTAFPTLHRVPSIGFALTSKHVGALKPEYANAAREQLATLTRQGVVVKEVTERVEVVYTGDTSFEGLLIPSNSFVFEVPLLIMELTYLEGTLDSSRKHGHIHLQDVVDHAHLFQNEFVVFFHVSSRYTKATAIRSILEHGLPQELCAKSGVTLNLFGFREYVTKLRVPRSSRSEEHHDDGDNDDGAGIDEEEEGGGGAQIVQETASQKRKSDGKRSKRHRFDSHRAPR